MDAVSVSFEGPVCRLTLNEPERLNPLNDARREALHAAIRDVGSRLDVRVVVLQGAGRVFSAGADLRAGGGEPPARWLERRRAAGGWQRLLDDLEGLPQVTVASLHGWAIGGAGLLAIACDLRIAEEGFRYSIPEVAIGIPLTWGGNPRLVRELGLPRARDLVMTGRVLSTAEAMEWGVITRLAPSGRLGEATDALVAELLAMPEAPLAMTKDSFAALSRRGMELGWADADLIYGAGHEPERREAARAYAERNLGTGRGGRDGS